VIALVLVLVMISRWKSWEYQRDSSCCHPNRWLKLLTSTVTLTCLASGLICIGIAVHPLKSTSFPCAVSTNFFVLVMGCMVVGFIAIIFGILIVLIQLFIEMIENWVEFFSVSLFLSVSQLLIHSSYHHNIFIYIIIISFYYYYYNKYCPFNNDRIILKSSQFFYADYLWLIRILGRLCGRTMCMHAIRHVHVCAWQAYEELWWPSSSPSPTSDNDATPSSKRAWCSR
jgi:hypothetical protein